MAGFRRLRLRRAATKVPAVSRTRPPTGQSWPVPGPSEGRSTCPRTTNNNRQVHGPTAPGHEDPRQAPGQEHISGCPAWRTRQVVSRMTHPSAHYSEHQCAQDLATLRVQFALYLHAPANRTLSHRGASRPEGEVWRSVEGRSPGTAAADLPRPACQSGWASWWSSSCCTPTPASPDGAQPHQDSHHNRTRSSGEQRGITVKDVGVDEAPSGVPAQASARGGIKRSQLPKLRASATGYAVAT